MVQFATLQNLSPLTHRYLLGLSVVPVPSMPYTSSSRRKNSYSIRLAHHK